MRKSAVLAHFGTLQAIANALNISKSAVGQWKERIPQGPAYKLQFVTGGILQVDPSMYPKIKHPRTAEKIAKKKRAKTPSKHSAAESFAAV